MYKEGVLKMILVITFNDQNKMFEWHWATVTQLSLGNSENDENVSRDSGSDSELQKNSTPLSSASVFVFYWSLSRAI